MNPSQYNHYRLHHSNGKYKECGRCGHIDTAGALANHDCTGQSLICQHCAKVFRNPACLAGHVKNMHIRHGCQMAIARFLDRMCLALRTCRTMAPLGYTAKYDPFLSLDCARVEGGGLQSKERKVSNFAAQCSDSPSSPKCQTHTIKKFGYSHLATMLLSRRGSVYCHGKNSNGRVVVVSGSRKWNI